MSAASGTNPHPRRARHGGRRLGGAAARPAGPLALMLMLVLTLSVLEADSVGAARRMALATATQVAAAGTGGSVEADRAQELRRQLRDHSRRWRVGGTSEPSPATTAPLLSTETLQRPSTASAAYKVLSDESGSGNSVQGKVLRPDPALNSRLTPAERELLHQQLRQIAREQALRRSR